MKIPRPRIAVFAATSLDGHIARPDGGLDWLEAANARLPPGEDCGFRAFLDGADLLAMGRASFEAVLGLGRWPYEGKPVEVLSRQALVLPRALRESVSVVAGEPAELAARWAAQGLRRVYLDGGQTVQRFLAAGLVDEITLTIVPVLLGAGRPLFGALPRELALVPLETRSYGFGFVQLRYAVQPG
ncbi:dihydrofolate reductase family protein [Caldimonas tepidiphila]|uniref:dihydrofolate reductase family protein n=1 Tax=Caldimonas tepidiphila TaxID=2315841 RepID=UPI001F0C9BE1|nr:dihydrofolate reductase family protein [Caldimonas tepidiphila]